MEAGANFEAQTDTGERPLHLAIQRMDTDILLTLLDAGVDKEAPAALVWDSEAPLTPIEMASSLPKAVGVQMSSCSQNFVPGSSLFSILDHKTFPLLVIGWRQQQSGSTQV